MLKKALIGTGAAAALGTFVFGTSAFSYIRTGVHEAREAVRAEVPLDFEIARARQEIEHIAPEIENCMHVIAEQQYDIEQREADIARRDADLTKQKEAILALRADLDSGKQFVSYAGRTFSCDAVRQDLGRRFDRFKTAEETLKRDRQVVEARHAALAKNEEKLDNWLAVKKELAVKVENLQARLAAVQAAEAVSDLRIDDSQLARAKQLIHELDKKIGTRETLLSNEGRFTGEIPVEVEQEMKAKTENVEEQVDAYFGQTPATTPTSVAPEA
jgi:peptidoglycan hydrolase CwlO-like protein